MKLCVPIGLAALFKKALGREIDRFGCLVQKALGA